MRDCLRQVPLCAQQREVAGARVYVDTTTLVGWRCRDSWGADMPTSEDGVTPHGAVDTLDSVQMG
jgi:hypothetical protein